MARVIISTALVTLGLSGAPFHEPFHPSFSESNHKVVARCQTSRLSDKVLPSCELALLTTARLDMAAGSGRLGVLNHLTDRYLLSAGQPWFGPPGS